MIGLMRVRNEARWIQRCVESILPVCDRVLVMDDHSDDETPLICSGIPGVTVFESPFTGLNETRDKNHLLAMARDADWVLMIDGDELLAADSVEAVRAAERSDAAACSFRIRYLWDSEDQVRTDGVYGQFRRPSMFRPQNHAFQSTSAGGNFHCGNVPSSLQRVARPLDASLLHFGYLHKSDRIRKYEWYNGTDPGNWGEDLYQHMVIGDVFPVDSRFRYGGPLRLEALAS